MADKIEKKGSFYLTRTITDVTLDVLRDCGMSLNSRRLMEAQLKKPKGLDKYPQFYILSGGLCYRVNDRTVIDEKVMKALEGDEKAGIPVTFKTPAVKRGKHRWAYEVTLAS